MKKIKFTLILVSVCTILGCSSIETQPSEKYIGLKDWIETNNILMKERKISESQYYRTFYQKVAEPPVNQVDTVMLSYLDAMIMASELLETKKIKAEEYQHLKRKAEIEKLSAMAEVDRQMKSVQEEGRRNSMLFMMLSKPYFQPYQVPTPTYHQIQTNCFSNGPYTNCTTR